MANRQMGLEKIANVYEDNPIVRALITVVIGLIPHGGIAGAIDAALTKKIENINEERHRTFFDELALGSMHLTEDLGLTQLNIR